MQEAMQQAKDTYGDDAVVLHTRKVRDDSLAGTDQDELIEITVAAEKDIQEGSPAAAKPFYSPADARRREPRKASPKTDTVFKGTASQLQILDVQKELKQIRASLNNLRDDVRRSHMNLLPDTYHFLEKEKGVEADLASELVQNVFLKLDGADIKNDDMIKKTLQAEILRSLKVNKSLDIEMGKPKVVCLVGPTGMGKTTSIIKLATHPEFYGRNRVGLITIDTYRVAAAAQLKTFAALAQIPLEIAYEPSDFAQALRKMRNEEVILIDTAGRSPANAEHLDDLKEFFKVLTPDEIHLVLSVSTRPDNLLDAAENFSSLPINRMIISKIDETRRLGNILNLGNKIDLPISFLTNGQKVPDDIELADKSQIANLIID